MLILIYVILVAGLSDLNRCSLKIQIFYFTWKYFLPLPGKIPGDAHALKNLFFKIRIKNQNPAHITYEFFLLAL